MRKIRGAKSIFENVIMDQADPLLIKKPEGWVFDKKFIIDAEYDGKHKGCRFFPALVRDWHQDYTGPMAARWAAIEDHWKKIALGTSYLFPQFYTPDGNRILPKEGYVSINEAIRDAFDKHGRVTEILFAYVDEKNHHHIDSRSLRLAYKRYGHLFTQEFIDLAKQKQIDKKSKFDVFAI